MTKSHIARVLGSAAAAGLAAALIVPGAAASAPQDGRFIAASKDRAIPNSYIVVFKDTASLRATATVGSAARELSGKHGAKLGHTYTSSVRGFSATVSEAKAREIASRPARRLRAAERQGPRLGHAGRRDLGPRPDRPARPAADDDVHVRHDRRRTCTRTSSTPASGPRTPSSAAGRSHGFDSVDNDGNADRLQRPRHARRRHGRRHRRTAWPRASTLVARPGARLRRLRHRPRASSPASTG